MSLDDPTLEDLLIAIGNDSGCSKSRRAVIIINKRLRKIVSTGTNSPPMGFKCEKNEWCRANCNKLAVHAEEKAIISALMLEGMVGVFDADLIHAKIVDDKIVPSGPPSCWQCSRKILESGIGRVWLFHEDGWKQYEAKEFHRLTIEHCMPR